MTKFTNRPFFSNLAKFVKLSQNFNDIDYQDNFQNEAHMR